MSQGKILKGENEPMVETCDAIKKDGTGVCGRPARPGTTKCHIHDGTLHAKLKQPTEQAEPVDVEGLKCTAVHKEAYTMSSSCEKYAVLYDNENSDAIEVHAKGDEVLDKARMLGRAMAALRQFRKANERKMVEQPTSEENEA